LSISPPVTEVLLAPNKTATQTIQLANNGEDTAFSLSLHKLIPTDDLGHSTIDPTPYTQSNTPLEIKIQGKEFDTSYPFPANSTIPLTLNFTSATVEEPLDFYLALVAKIENSESLTQSSTTTPGISLPLLITLTPLPALPTDIAINQFSPPQLHDSSLPLKVPVIIENKAPIMLRIKGTLALISPTGKVVQESIFDPTLILGHTTRSLPSTKYQVPSTTIGPHTLKLTIQTEGGRILLESEKPIFFAPLRPILILIVIALSLTTFFLRQKRLTSLPPKD